MVLLVERLGHYLKFSSKLENHHHHHQSEALSASLQAFRSDVSNCLNQLSLNSKPGLEILSLFWIQQCFGLLPIINKAFAKLVMDIDYPMSNWEVASIEEYLKYSLNLLELLNSISATLSHLGQARLSLSHALSLVENSPSLAIERLKAIQSRSFSKECREEENKEDSKERFCSGKEWIINQALIEIKNIGLWVCAIVLSGLCGDVKPYVEMRTLAGGFVNSSLMGLDSSVCEEITEKRGLLKEVKEVNDAAASLVAAIVIGKNGDAAEELHRKLEVFEKLVDGVGEEADRLFSEILAGRNELLRSLRQCKQ